MSRMSITQSGDELLKCVPDEKAFGCAITYHVQPKLTEDLHQSLKPKVLPNVKNHPVGPIYINDQISKICVLDQTK